MKKITIKSVTAVVLVISLSLTGGLAANAADELEVDPQTLVFEMTPTVTATGTTIDFDFPDAYYSNFVQVQYGAKIASGLTTYKTFDRFALEALDGKMTIESPIKLKKGQVLRVRIGARFVKTVTIK